MSTWILEDTNRGTTRECDSKTEAEDAKQDLIGLGANADDLEITPPGKTDGGETETHSVEMADDAEPTNQPVQQQDLPDEPPSVEHDPVDWLPSHFIDTIQGVPTVNRKGYAVIAAQYNASVVAEPVTLASETDFEYAEFKAIATTSDGQEYSGFGSAHVERMDGDDPHLLNELAETRAMKRATAWATGVGMTAASEMMGEL